MRSDPDCICWGQIEATDAYSYLLGLYLGDGCISAAPKGVFKLRITLDQRYLGILGECAEAMALLRPHSPTGVGFFQSLGCIEVHAHWKHWPCVFPQHGAGPKHKRRILLTSWQRDIVDAWPHLLLRGLIHSDGCRSDNRIRGRDKWYVYPRYQFSNRSNDIRQIFCDACDAVGIEWRQMNRWTIAVSRREAVATLDTFIGPKV